MSESKDKWEFFCDKSYYDMWLVRKKDDRKFGKGFHLINRFEAGDLCELLNSIEAQMEMLTNINKEIDMTPAEKYEAIILKVALSRYTTVDAIKGHSRDKFAFLARQEAALRLADNGLNTVQIAKYLNRDPSTILNMLGRLGKSKHKDKVAS